MGDYFTQKTSCEEQYKVWLAWEYVDHICNQNEILCCLQWQGVTWRCEDASQCRETACSDNKTVYNHHEAIQVSINANMVLFPSTCSYFSVVRNRGDYFRKFLLEMMRIGKNKYLILNTILQIKSIHIKGYKLFHGTTFTFIFRYGMQIIREAKYVI
jgi:hypothetical protein